MTPFAIAMADKYRLQKEDDEDDFDFAIRSYQHCTYRASGSSPHGKTGIMSQVEALSSEG